VLFNNFSIHGLGDPLNISTFFPSVKVTAAADGKYPTLHGTFTCYDIPKKFPDGYAALFCFEFTVVFLLAYCLFIA
jgi:hypothetical protein